MEDVDVAFTASRQVGNKSEEEGGEDQRAVSLISLSGLLNAIDGIAGSEGRIREENQSH
jgi:hypothetical protein